MTRPFLPALAASLLLAACSGAGDAPVAEEGAGAQGEILEGSISDAMLPVDQVRSQSPRAQSAPGEDGSASAPASAPDASASAEAEEERPAEPAAESSGEDSEN